MKPPGEPHPTHTSIPVSWSPEKAERKSVLLPVTKFTVICCSGPPLGATPAYFQQKQWRLLSRVSGAEGVRLGAWGQRWGEVMRGEVKAATWVRQGQSTLLGRRLQVGHCLLESPLG